MTSPWIYSLIIAKNWLEMLCVCTWCDKAMRNKFWHVKNVKNEADCIDSGCLRLLWNFAIVRIVFNLFWEKCLVLHYLNSLCPYSRQIPCDFWMERIFLGAWVEKKCDSHNKMAEPLNFHPFVSGCVRMRYFRSFDSIFVSASCLGTLALIYTPCCEHIFEFLKKLIFEMNIRRKIQDKLSELVATMPDFFQRKECNVHRYSLFSCCASNFLWFSSTSHKSALFRTGEMWNFTLATMRLIGSFPNHSTSNKPTERHIVIDRSRNLASFYFASLLSGSRFFRLYQRTMNTSNSNFTIAFIFHDVYQYDCYTLQAIHRIHTHKKLWNLLNSNANLKFIWSWSLFLPST